MGAAKIRLNSDAEGSAVQSGSGAGVGTCKGKKMVDITFDAAGFGLGCLGALGHEALRWMSLKTEDQLPTYFRQLHYWLLTALLVALGGLLAALLDPATPLQALSFGIAAPSILSRLGTAIPPSATLGPGDGVAAGAPSYHAQQASLREFLRG
jgi:hypothetical protein